MLIRPLKAINLIRQKMAAMLQSNPSLMHTPDLAMPSKPDDDRLVFFREAIQLAEKADRRGNPRSAP